MEILELYDGESRSKLWWKVVRRHTIALSIFAPVGVLLLLAAFDLAPGGIGLSGLLQFWILVSLTSWPILFGLSMLSPRFSFSLYYWNGWLMLILLAPAVVASVIVSQTLSKDPAVGFATVVATYVIGVSLKTLILYRRFTMAASDKGKQRLPT